MKKVIWLTGLPCSGKTTIAKKLEKKLRESRLRVEWLDNDIVRPILCGDLGFSREDREENIRRMVFISDLLSRNNTIVIASFISPYKSMREYAQNVLGKRYIEVFVKCPVGECEKRDVKGMYKKAREGEIENFTGVSDPYEEPENPDIVLDTSTLTVKESVEALMSCLQRHRT